jgi:organic radical activating enzyme
MKEAENYNHAESVYWVFTQLCNDECDHCYNSSGPQGERISTEDCLKIIDNLPETMDRLILSGGEPLADRKKLYAILEKLEHRYQGSVEIMIQTNGDLLSEKRLKELIEKGVTRFDIASIDRYHKKAGARLDELKVLFDSQGVNGESSAPLIAKDNYVRGKKLSWGYWGATDDMWLGGNWARGRALEKDIWKRDAKHNFCGLLSGAIGFLDGAPDIPQEISIQLWAINPCCPGTKDAMGDARTEKVAEVLERVSHSEIFKKLNQGDAYGMGESIGISRAYAEKRGADLQNVCLWCDEFFTHHFNMKKLQAEKDELPLEEQYKPKKQALKVSIKNGEG